MRVARIERSPESGRNRNFELPGEKVAHPLFEVINRIEWVSPTDEANVATMRGKIELEIWVA
jgi:hypothetical protein